MNLKCKPDDEDYHDMAMNKQSNKAGAPTNIDDYINEFSGDVRNRSEQIRATIKEAAPHSDEMIKYQMPTFFLYENLVHFAACKNHIGFYPTPSAFTHFKEELSTYKGAKGSVQFPIDQPMPLSLIRKMVEFRVMEVIRKYPRKK